MSTYQRQPFVSVIVPVYNGEGIIATDLPMWASMVCTDESVYSTLRTLGVDTPAMQQAYLVVQRFGDDGLKTLQDICSNVIKNWDYIDNKSAFVAVACVKYKRSREPKPS